jgi:hypothetical protein
VDARWTTKPVTEISSGTENSSRDYGRTDRTDNLFDLRPDWKALLLLAQLKQRNAESIFAAIANDFQK